MYIFSNHNSFYLLAGCWASGVYTLCIFKLFWAATACKNWHVCGGGGFGGKEENETNTPVPLKPSYSRWGLKGSKETVPEILAIKPQKLAILLLFEMQESISTQMSINWRSTKKVLLWKLRSRLTSGALLDLSPALHPDLTRSSPPIITTT